MKMRFMSYVCISLLLVGIADASLDNREIFVGGSARLIGLGSTGIAGPADSTSLFWNPALYGTQKQTEFSFTDAPLQPDATEREGFLSLLLRPDQIEHSIPHVGLGLVSWLDGWGRDEEKNRIIRTGLGAPLSHGFSAGIGLLHERRNTRLGTEVGWGFDLGLLWETELPRFGDHLRLGLAGQRIAGRREWRDQTGLDSGAEPTVRTPFRLRWGVGYQPDPATVLNVDFAYVDDERIATADRLRAHLGLERWLFERIGVRIGYTGIAHYDRFTDGEWSRGLGLRTRSAEFDYAYVSGENLSEGVHWITATIRWSGMPETIDAAAEPAPTPLPQPAITKLTVAPRVFSPNGDGKHDRVRFEITASPENPWAVLIKNDAGQLVQELPPKEPLWNGLDDGGLPVPDGTYHVEVVQMDDRSVLAAEQVIVDTTSPGLTLTVEPLILMSQEMVIDVAKVHVNARDANDFAGWSLSVVEDGGEPLAEFSGEEAPPQTLIWDNWQQSVTPDKIGEELSCHMRVTDVAGNVTEKSAELLIVDLAQMNSRREEQGIVMTLPGVAFDTDSAEIRPEFFDPLREVAQALQAYPEAAVRIEGHTDDRGTENYNMDLSLTRANAVMEYLIETFEIDPARISARGYGETRPIANNETEEGRRQNRRVEIVLLLTQEAEGAQPEARPDAAPDEDATPAESSTGNALPQSDARYTVSVGTFRDPTNAETLLQTVKSLNLPYEIRLIRVPMDGEIFYRVTVGGFENESAAAKLTDVLEEEHGLLPVLMPYEAK